MQCTVNILNPEIGHTLGFLLKFWTCIISHRFCFLCRAEEVPATQQAAKPQTQANGTGNLGQICTSSLMQSDLFFFTSFFWSCSRKSNVAEELAGSWRRLLKKPSMKEHLSSFLPLYMILLLLFVDDFVCLSKETILYYKPFRNVMNCCCLTLLFLHT